MINTILDSTARGNNDWATPERNNNRTCVMACVRYDHNGAMEGSLTDALWSTYPPDNDLNRRNMEEDRGTDSG